MLDLAIASKERHDRFVQRVIASREVWGLMAEGNVVLPVLFYGNV
jgi:hypothetical protein